MSFYFSFPYKPDPAYAKKVAYFCMEYAIHQPLKTYAGGLGFLAGSHMRSAYQLKQHTVGIGILWKYGYYDQGRKGDQSMEVQFREKLYGFLIKMDISFTVSVSGHDVQVAVYYLPPEVFGTAPVFFLSTDVEENDYLAKTICHKLYDSNPETRIAAAILLGVGGAKLLDAIGWEPQVYHLNESHALPLAFYLCKKYRDVAEVKKRLVFTNHTPEPGGNEKNNLSLLTRFGFFAGLSTEEITAISGPETALLDHTLSALLLAGISNGVSKAHLQYLTGIWLPRDGMSRVISITNAQNFSYWHDELLYDALHKNDSNGMRLRKAEMKKLLFEEVADQSGEIYNEKICTIVFAKRFGGYKRPDLLLQDMGRFQRMITNQDQPVQVIWAGKPHPMDYSGIAVFDKIAHICKTYPNCSLLTGYELKLSKLLKQGADVWLNVPRITHEASGTSGMSAAMNGGVNVSIPDGWFPEFAKDGVNAFIVPACDSDRPEYEQDEADAAALFDVLEKKVLPLFYNSPGQWNTIIQNSMNDILPQFDSNRMVKEYYEKLYNAIPLQENTISNLSA